MLNTLIGPFSIKTHWPKQLNIGPQLVMSVDPYNADEPNPVICGMYRSSCRSSCWLRVRVIGLKFGPHMDSPYGHGTLLKQARPVHFMGWALTGWATAC